MPIRIHTKAYDFVHDFTKGMDYEQFHKVAYALIQEADDGTVGECEDRGYSEILKDGIELGQTASAKGEDVWELEVYNDNEDVSSFFYFIGTAPEVMQRVKNAITKVGE